MSFRAVTAVSQLDSLRIASPCTASWDQMVGDDRVRHCGECEKSVYNFSGMTRDEVESLLVEKNGYVCARYYQRTDGTILLADCLVGIRKRRRRRIVAAGAAALLASGAGYVVATRGAPEPEPSAMMGAIRTEPDPSPAEPPPSMDGSARQVSPEPLPAHDVPAAK